MAVVIGSVELVWAQAVLIASTGNPFTPITPPDGSTPLEPPSLAPTYVLPARDTYNIVHTVTVTDINDNSPVELTSFSISDDDGSAVWTFNAAAPASLFSKLAATGDPSVWRVEIDGLPWLFIIEGVQRNRQFANTTLNVTGRSITMAAGAPYDFARNWVNEGPVSAAQIIDQAQINNGMQSIWSLEDWLVPDKVWTFSGTPLEVAQRVASAVDAIIASDPVENRITITPRYPVLPNAWPTVAPDVEIHIDATMVDSYERADAPAYNGVYVSGQQQGVLCYVHLAGTSGDKLAPLITDLLITEGAAGAQRGIAQLGRGGPGANVSMTLPVIVGGNAPGVIFKGMLCHVVGDGDADWYGMVRSVRVDYSAFPSLSQTLVLERRTGAIEGTVVEGA